MPDEQVPAQTGEGDEPDSPLEMSPPDWKAGVRRGLKEFKDDRGTLVAAGMGFYWFLAVFPAIVAAVGVLGLVDAGPEARDSITKAVEATLPGDAARVLTDAVDKAGEQPGGAAVVATLVGVALALWSASAGMVAMQSGLNVAYDVDRDRTFVKKRVVALLLLVVTAVLGGVATALTVFGQPLGDALRDRLPFDAGFVVVWTALRWSLAVVALGVLFAAFYYLAPNRDSPRWSWVSPGGLIGALIWLAASLGFSFYVSSFGNYAETYGSLAGVVVLLLWLYLTALAVVLGGEINAELERQGEMSGSGASGAGEAAFARQQRSPEAHRVDGGTPPAEWSERMRSLRR